MAAISLCVLLRNDEKEWKFAKLMLDRMAKWTDEIVIVCDDDTPDDYLSSVENLNAKIVKMAWKDDFSASRNESLRHATKDWILVLDADEIILDDDMKKLKSAIDANDVDAFELLQATYNNNRFDPRWVEVDNVFTRKFPFRGCVVVPIVRLFRNNGNVRFVHRAHEVVDEAELDVKRLNIPIHHLKYVKGPEAFRFVELRTIELMKKEIEENPKYVKPYLDIGTLHTSLTGRYDEAIEYLKKALELDPGSAEVLLNLGRAYSAKGDYEKAVETYTRLIELHPDTAAAYFNLAAVYSKMSEDGKAIGMYEASLEHGFHDHPLVKDRIDFLRKRAKEP